MLLADLRTVWVWANMYEQDLAVLLGKNRTPTPIEVSVHAFPDRVFRGKIDYIGATMDERTRAVKVRLTVKNDDRLGSTGNKAERKDSTMKMIVAYIQPFMLERVADAPRKMHAPGMTVLKCQGFGHQVDGATPGYLDKGVRIDFVPKTKIEIVCQDALADEIIRAICENAHTGRHGDGKIFVADLSTAVSIRTGETGQDVI